MTGNPLLRLRELGQSVWCDNISRGTITSDIAAMIQAGEITGLTSNPTIFEKAMTTGAEYEADFVRLARAGRSAEEIFEALALDDIRAVADLLRPVYEATERRDGYVSFEVSPHLARDTEGSYRAARRLFDLIGRENVMIKIPGTPEGLPAIERSLADGININITLLFSLENYEQVAEAYLRGLERRLADGRPIDHVASVASFFVSRVDTAVDRIIDERAAAGDTSLEDLRGKSAIANARLAYQRFKEIFGGERFQRLAARGAMLQRPLWASTSTKNPAYRDVLYVEELIGPNTVNTLPPATIAAFRDHGRAELTLEKDLPAAEAAIRRLREAGLYDQVTRQLQIDGVAAFADSFDKLLAAVERKRAALAAAAAGPAAD